MVNLTDITVLPSVFNGAVFRPKCVTGVGVGVAAECVAVDAVVAVLAVYLEAVQYTISPTCFTPTV